MLLKKLCRIISLFYFGFHMHIYQQGCLRELGEKPNLFNAVIKSKLDYFGHSQQARMLLKTFTLAGFWSNRLLV